MSSILTQLKLVTAKRASQATPVQQRRNKLLKQLHEQIQLAAALAEGRTYAPSKLKTHTDPETGARVTQEVAKKVKAWWWSAHDNKLMLSVRYGARVLALGKNVNAIEVGDTSQLAPTLLTVKQAVEAGEMDAALDTASSATRKAFK